MALYKRNKTYWIDISHQGNRIQQSTGTSNKSAAQEFHDKFKAELWRQSKLKEKPKKMWVDAAIRWISESSHKRSLKDDKMHLRWLSPFLETRLLEDINCQLIQKITKAKVASGVSIATVNRLLSVIRAILRKAAYEWEWLDRPPKIRLMKEDNHRTRWLSTHEAERLLAELPKHLADMALFTLVTGLRQSNVTTLKWKSIDLKKQHAWIGSEYMKNDRAIAVPLNQVAMNILQRCLRKHAIYVFTYRGKPVHQVNTKAWRNALKRAGIENFRWHDLRHTWASWHVQNGTSLQELQQLGGWSNYAMVLRYAHLSSQHLKEAASRIDVTIPLQVESESKIKQEGI